jgi:uncharacterized membrane protein
MPNVVVLTFEDPDSALNVLKDLKGLQKQGLINVEDSAVVVKDAEGKIHVKNETGEAIKIGALTGGFLGLLLLFMFPIAGIAIGAVGGALVGKSLDRDVDQKFVKDVTESLQPNNSALFTMTSGANVNAALSALKPYKGTLYHSSLDPEVEDSIRRALKN